MHRTWTSHSTVYQICSRQSYVKYQTAKPPGHHVFIFSQVVDGTTLNSTRSNRMNSEVHSDETASCWNFADALYYYTGIIRRKLNPELWQSCCLHGLEPVWPTITTNEKEYHSPLCSLCICIPFHYSQFILFCLLPYPILVLYLTTHSWHIIT
jgi:hypothetical protein